MRRARAHRSQAHAAGAPHRGGIKKLARQLGATESLVEGVVSAAIDAGLVMLTDDDVLRPEPSRVLAAARGTYSHDGALAAVVRRLADGPVALELVGRRLERAGTVLPIARLAWLPGLCVGRAGEVAAIQADPVVGSAAASVTPSFEVFLPPESRLEDIVHVLAAAELVRIDRVIVARITKESIGSTGIPADTLLAGLAGACRTPIPQNVEIAIREWAQDARHAVIATGQVVVVPADHEIRVRAALAAFDPRVVAAGVLVFSVPVPPGALADILGKLGIHPRKLDHGLAAISPPTTRALGSLDADDRLRARVVAYRAGAPAERTAIVPLPSRPAPASPRRSIDPGVLDLLDRWTDRTGEAPAAGPLGLVATVLQALGGHDRRFILDAPDAEQLTARALSVIERGDLPPDVVAALGEVAVADRLVWHRDHVHARVEAAARTHARLVLDVGKERITVAVSRVIRQGAAQIVLGEGDDDQRVAIPLATICAVAELPAATKPWRPAAGQREPAGHLPCPCKTGKRYRDCCRALPPS